MRRSFVTLVVLLAASAARAQGLPAGTYEPYFTDWNGALAYWLGGDIAIMDGARYEFQGSSGRYAVDAFSGRITFVGGGLDGAFARVRASDGRPAIVIPAKENEEIGREYAISDIWAYRKK